MTIKEENNFGEITISESVLRDITFKTTEKMLKEKEIYTNKIQRELIKTIKILKNEDGSIGVVLKLPAKYGENIVDFSRTIQSLIKDELEKMSEIFVNNIDITIESLEHSIEQDEDEQVSIEEIEKNIDNESEYEVIEENNEENNEENMEDLDNLEDKNIEDFEEKNKNEK